MTKNQENDFSYGYASAGKPFYLYFFYDRNLIQATLRENAGQLDVLNLCNYE